MLKPVDEPAEAIWCAQVVTALPQRGYRVPRPLRTRDGLWVAHGYTASEYVEARPGPAGRWTELLAAARALHADLATVSRPIWINHRTHRWAHADGVAWGEQQPTMVQPVLDRLRAALRQVDLPAQIVHGDLAGNVLFPNEGPPLIVDFSPYWRPAGYAEAIVAVDGTLWHDAPDELLAQCPVQLLLRATIFRLVAHDRAATHDDELPAFTALADRLTAR